MKNHLILLMADQLRADVLNEEFTPNIMQLAREGVSFDRGYCASPLCVPARGAFFTGTYPNVNGSLINPWEPAEKVHGDVKAGIPNLYELMEENGWDCRHTGKQHLYTAGGKLEDRAGTKTKWVSTHKTYGQFLEKNGYRRPGGPDFRSIVPEMACGKVTRKKDYSIPATGRYEDGFDAFFDGYFTNGALKAIRNRNPEKPFFLSSMFLAPHPPYDIPEPWFSMYKEVALPENVGRWSENQSPLQLYNLPGFFGSRYTRKDWEKVWPVYLGLVSLLDYCVGLIIKELKEQGIYDDSVILFTSDHGEMLGSHGLWQKMCMYEEAVRIPLIWKLPAGNGTADAGKDPNGAGITVDTPVSAVDVFPTLCDLLEIKTPEHMNGITFRSCLDGENADSSGYRENIFIQFDGNGARGNFQRTVINGPYKLTADIFKDEVFIELYNLLDDPQEQKNLAFLENHKGRIRKMLDDLSSHMKETGDLLALNEDVYRTFISNYKDFAVQAV